MECSTQINQPAFRSRSCNSISKSRLIQPFTEEIRKRNSIEGYRDDLGADLSSQHSLHNQLASPDLISQANLQHAWILPVNAKPAKLQTTTP